MTKDKASTGTDTISGVPSKILDFPAGGGSSLDPWGSDKRFDDPGSWAKELDREYPGWSSRIVTARLVGGFALVTVTVTVTGLDREGLGYSSFDEGSGFLAAEQMAFCEAASKFISGADAFFGSGNGSNGEKSSPVASCLADMVTGAQLRAIRKLANSKGVDAAGAAERMFGCLPSEMSRDAASIFIRELEAPSAQGSARLLMAG